MKAFKRFFALLLCVLMVLSCSCQSGGGETTTDPTPDNPPAATDPATGPETTPETIKKLTALL